METLLKERRVGVLDLRKAILKFELKLSELTTLEKLLLYLVL